MIASQVNPDFQNEDKLVLPVASGRLIGEFEEETDIPLFGAVSIHNELGNNKSVLLPLYRAENEATLIATALGQVAPDSIKSLQPEWFNKACENSACGGRRVVDGGIKTIFTSMGSDAPINRSYQVNLLIDKADDLSRKQPSAAIKSLSYEILTGEAEADLATYRRVYPMDEFVENGHMLEAVLRCTMMPVWHCKNFDMPYSICRDVRWLGAQYLTKNTKGNLFPQLLPIIDDVLRQARDREMQGMNEHWGALGFLSSARKA
tara:strand:- start:1347 stop:2132 length:786 start_codon:yes stop_codon:yes gene_type:complete